MGSKDVGNLETGPLLFLPPSSVCPSRTIAERGVLAGSLQWQRKNRPVLEEVAVLGFHLSYRTTGRVVRSGRTNSKMARCVRDPVHLTRLQYLRNGTVPAVVMREPGIALDADEGGARNNSILGGKGKQLIERQCDYRTVSKCGYARRGVASRFSLGCSSASHHPWTRHSEGDLIAQDDPGPISTVELATWKLTAVMSWMMVVEHLLLALATTIVGWRL